MQTRGANKVASADAPVIATNDDAFLCKYAAVKRQYYVDDFLVAIVESSAIRELSPEFKLCKRIVEAFLGDESHEKHVQIISLGAGYDTLPFRLLEKEQKISFSYVELDFPSVTRTKSEIVKNVQCISDLFDTITNLPLGHGVAGAKSSISSGQVSKYKLHACELRDLASLSTAFENCEVDFSLPTLFLAECVLMYMDTAHSDALLNYAANRFTGPRCFVNYEPIIPSDPFGQQMVANIAARGSPLLGIEAYPDEHAQKKRFEKQVGHVLML